LNSKPLHQGFLFFSPILWFQKFPKFWKLKKKSQKIYFSFFFPKIFDCHSAKIHQGRRERESFFEAFLKFFSFVAQVVIIQKKI